MAHLELVSRRARPGRLGRGVIAGQLWPDLPERRAQGNLRSALWRLQKAAPGLVLSSGGALRLADGVCTDVRELVHWARRILDPLTDVTDLVTPPAAFYGEILPGWYDEWIQPERDHLRQLRMHALEQLCAKLAHAGRYGEAIEAAQAAIFVEPLRESAHRALLDVHLAEGNLVEAIRAYDGYRALLERELGIRPTPLMESLFGRLCPKEAVSRTSAVPAGGQRARLQDR